MKNNKMVELKTFNKKLTEIFLTTYYVLLIMFNIILKLQNISSGLFELNILEDN